MTISAKLLNGNIINRDADFSKYIETVSEAGVIEGFQVSANAVAKGKARVPCERSNGEKLFVLVLNDNNVPIDGNGDVYINIAQSHIDNGELSSDDGTGIATIEVGTMPSKNALKLAVKNGSTITDERNMLKKISDLEGLIDGIEERTATLEEEIGEILDKGAIDHLEESGIVGEKYTLSDTLFHQLEPISSNCTLEANVGDVAANRQIHIQRIGSGTESNQIKLKLKKVGEPTQNLIVEVRRGVKVDVSNNEAYWYGGELITTSSIAYGNITTDFAEYTVTFSKSFGATQGELLNIVVRQGPDIVNSTNYYVIACDSTQYSEAYSYVAVNGSTIRVRSKLMPYCSSVGFAQSLLCKVNIAMPIVYRNEGQIMKNSQADLFSVTAPYDATYVLTCTAHNYSVGGWFNFSSEDDGVGSGGLPTTDTPYNLKIHARAGSRVWVNGYRTVMSDITVRPYVSNQGNKTLFQYNGIMVTGTYSFTSDVTGTIFFRYQVNDGTTGSQYAANITINKNGTQVYYLNGYNNSGPKTFELEVNTGDVIDMITANSAEPATQAVTRQIRDMIVQSNGQDIELRPSRIYEIGVVGVGTTFGTINGVFKGGQFIGTDTAVTTGTIALGNAVGFLEVNYMGEIYKVPYYK